MSDTNYLELLFLEALGLILRRSESFWEVTTTAVRAEREYGEPKIIQGLISLRKWDSPSLTPPDSFH